MRTAAVGLTAFLGRDVPRSSDWLTPGERAHLAGIRLPRARRDYRLGRWTAKHGVRGWLPGRTQLGELEIRRAADGAPAAWLRGQPAGCGLSLSHRAGAALCAVAAPPLGVGCDVEVEEPRSAAFVAHFLSPREARQVSSLEEPERSRLATLLWSARESALKALRIGLDVDTRSMEVRLRGGRRGSAWEGSMSVEVQGTRLPGWWRLAEGRIWTLVGTQATAAPRWPELGIAPHAPAGA